MTSEEKKIFDTMREVINQHSKTIKQLVGVITDLQSKIKNLEGDIVGIRCKIDSKQSPKDTMGIFEDILNGKVK